MIRIFFFAMEADVRPTLRRVEKEIPLKFIETGITTSFVRPIYLSSEDISDIGVAKYPTGQTQKYLVSLRPEKNSIRKTHCDDKKLRWHLCNGDNINTVEFCAGGLWKNEILLDDGVCTLHTTPVADRLMRLFLRSIQQGRFKNIGDWWFGPQAFDMWRGGGRLTQSVQSPPEFDFKFPEELR